jgi:hypothetical protein
MRVAQNSGIQNFIFFRKVFGMSVEGFLNNGGERFKWIKVTIKSVPALKTSSTESHQNEFYKKSFKSYLQPVTSVTGGFVKKAPNFVNISPESNVAKQNFCQKKLHVKICDFRDKKSKSILNLEVILVNFRRMFFKNAQKRRNFAQSGHNPLQQGNFC